MNIADTIQQLGRSLGVAIALDARGACQLVFGGTIEVDLELHGPSGQQLVISASVGTVPKDGAEAMLKTLLEANLYARGTGGAVLAIDERVDEIVLMRALPIIGLALESLTRALEEFVHYAKIWIDRLTHNARALTDASLPARQEAGINQPALPEGQFGLLRV